MLPAGVGGVFPLGIIRIIKKTLANPQLFVRYWTVDSLQHNISYLNVTIRASRLNIYG